MDKWNSNSKFETKYLIIFKDPKAAEKILILRVYQGLITKCTHKKLANRLLGNNTTMHEDVGYAKVRNMDWPIFKKEPSVYPEWEQ